VSAFSGESRECEWYETLAPVIPILVEITMKKIHASWLLLAAAACGSPLGTEPAAQPNASSAAANLKPATSLVIEKISGDCASGITVRVTGQNLSARSRFGYLALTKTDNTLFPEAAIELGSGKKKSVEWTTLWPAEMINPSSGAKFKGSASAWVTDAWTGLLYQTNADIAPGC
jgi:hypothetical protein